MKGLRQFGVLVLLVLTSWAPAMACMTSSAQMSAQMSAQQRACCRTMSNPCGQMQMSTSHGCCQKTLANLYEQALDTKTAESYPLVVLPLWLAASRLANPVAAITAWVERPDYSPPKSQPSTISILRI